MPLACHLRSLIENKIRTLIDIDLSIILIQMAFNSLANRQDSKLGSAHVYVYMYLDTCTQIHVHVCRYMYMYVDPCTCVQIRVHVHRYMYIYVGLQLMYSQLGLQGFPSLPLVPCVHTIVPNKLIRRRVQIQNYVFKNADFTQYKARKSNGMTQHKTCMYSIY